MITGYPAYDLFNLNANVTVTKAVRMRMGVDNLFNKARRSAASTPPRTSPSASCRAVRSTRSFYDINGRRYYLGVTAKF